MTEEHKRSNIWSKTTTSRPIDTLALKHLLILKKCQNKMDCLIYEMFYIKNLNLLLILHLTLFLQIFSHTKLCYWFQLHSRILYHIFKLEYCYIILITNTIEVVFILHWYFTTSPTRNLGVIFKCNLIVIDQ